MELDGFLGFVVIVVGGYMFGLIIFVVVIDDVIWVLVGDIMLVLDYVCFNIFKLVIYSIFIVFEVMSRMEELCFWFYDLEKMYGYWIIIFYDV